MASGNTFSWQSLGKADYAQAHALVASLPPALRARIEGVSHEILCRLVYLMWYRAEHSGRGRAYAWPSLARLGTYVARSVRTVQRHIETLVKAGLLTTKERFTKSGTNTSSLYYAGAALLASLFSRYHPKRPIKWPTTKMADNDLKKGIEAAPNAGEPASDSAFLRKLREHRPHMPSGHVVSFAKPVVEEEMSVVDRKAMLIRQAEALKARGL